MTVTRDLAGKWNDILHYLLLPFRVSPGGLKDSNPLANLINLGGVAG